MRILVGAVGILLLAGVSPAMALGSNDGDQDRVQEISDLKEQIRLIESKLDALNSDDAAQPAADAGLEARLDEIIRQSPVQPLGGNSGFSSNALDGVTWDGSFDWRAAYWGNFPGAAGEDDSLSFDQKLVLGIGGRLSEKVTLHTELWDVRVWGRDFEPATGADGNLDMSQAYIMIDDAYGSGFDVTLGRHQIEHADGRQFGNDDWYLQPNSRYDGVTGVHEYSDNTTLTVHAVRVSDGDSISATEFSPNSGVTNANSDLYALYANHDAGDMGNFDLYWIYLDANSNSAASFDTPAGRTDSSRLSTFGVRWESGMEGISWNTEIAKQFGNVDGTHIANYLADNWAMTLDVTYDVGDGPVSSISAGYDYAEGGADSYRQLNGAASHGWFGVMDVMTWSNVVHFELAADLALMDDDSNINVSWHWLRLDDDTGFFGSRTQPVGAGGGDADVGQECDIVYSHPCGDSSSAEAGLGYFLPGDAYTNAFNSSNNVVFGYVRYGITF